MQKELSSTLEDYLEAIYRLERAKRAARVRDIAGYLGVSKSTVSAALKTLAAKRLVEYTPYELIVLTPEGQDKAGTIVMNHHIISHFLQTVLALNRERAEPIACEFEHAVDEVVVERFVCFLAFAQKVAADGPDLFDDFRRFLNEGSEDRACQALVQQYRNRLQSEVEAS